MDRQCDAEDARTAPANEAMQATTNRGPNADSLIGRLAQDIHELNPDYLHFEDEVVKLISAALPQLTASTARVQEVEAENKELKHNAEFSRQGIAELERDLLRSNATIAGLVTAIAENGCFTGEASEAVSTPQVRMQGPETAPTITAGSSDPADRSQSTLASLEALKAEHQELKEKVARMDTMGSSDDNRTAPVNEVERTALRELLARLAHQQWTGWMRHLYSKCQTLNDGDYMVIPKVWWVRWLRQMDTPYEGLSDTEQDSDRKEADRVIAILESGSWRHNQRAASSSLLERRGAQPMTKDDEDLATRVDTMGSSRDNPIAPTNEKAASDSAGRDVSD